MAKNKIDDPRNHLFEILEGLKDPEHPMDIERARVAATVAQVIINSAKVEIDLLKAVNADAPDTKFFGVPEERELALLPPRVALTNEDAFAQKRAGAR